MMTDMYPVSDVLSDTELTDGILKSVTAEKVYGASLMRVSSGNKYVYAETRISDLSRVFESHPDLMAVGVCDGLGCALGLVSRVHLFGLLGKPYGRDVLARKTVKLIMEDARQFDLHANLFLVADELRSQIDRSSIHHYLLVTPAGHFMGIFSSKDLLLYLSFITQEDINLAGKLQDRLVKSRQSLSGENWSAEAFTQSAKGLGGDMYQMTQLPDGRVFLAIGDVSGKGVAASIVTSLLWGLLRFYDYRRGLRRLLSQVNEALVQSFHLEKYVTGIFMIYHPETRDLQVADMGHGHSWIFRKGRTGQLRLPRLNLPVGIEEDLDINVFRTRLSPGDVLAVCTDGLIEQENSRNEEFGTQRIVRIVNGGLEDPACIPERMQNLLAAHQGRMPRLDDVTWLQLHVT